MKKENLFILLAALFFKNAQSIKSNQPIYTGYPNCFGSPSKSGYTKDTTFVFVLDRAADWESYTRVLYLYKQLSCMIPIDDLIQIIFLQYTTNENFLENPQRSDKIAGTIFATGYEQDYYNDDHCTRFNEALSSKLDELVNVLLRKPIQNVHFIVPIYSNAIDAKNCSMKVVFDERIQAGNNASLLNLHFNGININGEADEETMKKEGIIMNIPDVRIINPNEKFMVGPTETDYTKSLAPIVEELQKFLDNTTRNEETTSTSTSTSTTITSTTVTTTIATKTTPNPPETTTPKNATISKAALNLEDENDQERVLIIATVSLILLLLLVVFLCFLCWCCVWKSKEKKKRKNRKSGSGSDSKSISPPKKEPRIEGENVGELNQAGAAPVPPSPAPQLASSPFVPPPPNENQATPQDPLLPPPNSPPNKKMGQNEKENLDLSEHLMDDVEQNGTKLPRGYKGTKAPTAFRID